MKASYSLSHNHTLYKAYTPRSPPYKKKSEVSTHILFIFEDFTGAVYILHCLQCSELLQHNSKLARIFFLYACMK